MLTVISPAKTLDYETPPVTEAFSQPAHLTQSRKLIRRLRELGSDDIARLMNVSDNLAELNRKRYRQWKTPFKPDNARQALFAFKGDVYLGLDAYSLKQPDIDFAQQHLRILSGLYGLLRPLDLMQPYRLEMGTRIKVGRKKNLYDFWDNRITDLVNEDLASSKSKIILNLASKEYFHAIKPKLLNGELLHIHFKENRNGKYKVISFTAKKARGRMAHLIVKERITKPEDLKELVVNDYIYNEKLSDETNWVFTID